MLGIHKVRAKISIMILAWGLGALFLKAQLLRADAIDVRAGFDASQFPWSDKILSLNMPWDFFWNQLLEPNQEQSHTPLKAHPGPWNNIRVSDLEEASPHGFASYRLELDGLPRGVPLRFFSRHVMTAGKLFIFPSGHPEETVTAVIGQVDSESTTASKKMLSLDFVCHRSGPYTILMQVSNHSYIEGGMWSVPEIGRADLMQRSLDIENILNLSAIGIGISVAAYSFLMWIGRRTEKAALYLTLMALGGLSRNIGTNGLIAGIFSDSASDLLRSLEFLSIPCGIFFLLFIRANFITGRYTSWIRWLYVMSLILILASLILPPQIYTHYLLLYQLNILLIAMSSVWIIFLAASKRQQGIWMVLLGCCVIVIAVFYDVILVAQMQFAQVFIFPIAFGIFMIIQCQLIAQRAATVERTARLLAREREQIQRELRFEIEARFEIAGQLAHRLNNPLNYISTASHGLETHFQRTQEDILSLFQDDSEQDPSVTSLKRHFEQRFSECKDHFVTMSQGIDLAAQSIRELRNLSGIDGIDLKQYPLRKILSEVFTSLTPKSSDGLSTMTLDEIPEDAKIFTNLPILQNVLHRIFKMDTSFPEDVVEFHTQFVDEADSPMTGIIFSWKSSRPISVANAGESEASFNHSLKSCHARIHLVIKDHWFTLDLLVPKQINSKTDRSA